MAQPLLRVVSALAPNLVSPLHLRNISSFESAAVQSLLSGTEIFPFYYVHRRDIFSPIPDLQLSLAAPFIGFWVFCAFFYALDVSGWRWLERYRLHESKEVTRLNRATVGEVVRAVLTEQVLQTAIGLWWLSGRSDTEDATKINHALRTSALLPNIQRLMHLLLGSETGDKALAHYGPQVAWWSYWYAVPAVQMFIALFILDAWQYFGHRLFHTNKFLYKHFHSVHHRLYVPYCFGALYNHWVEAILLDIAGTAIAHSVSGMTVRQGMLLFAFATVKAVDDHCGYAFPWDPFHLFFANNVAYHDIHHRPWGVKFNYSQPFFIHWDNWLGTRWRGDRKRTAAGKEL